MRPPPYCSGEAARREEISGFTSDEISCYGKSCFWRGRPARDAAFHIMSVCQDVMDSFRTENNATLKIINIWPKPLALFHLFYLHYACLYWVRGYDYNFFAIWWQHQENLTYLVRVQSFRTDVCPGWRTIPSGSATPVGSRWPTPATVFNTRCKQSTGHSTTSLFQSKIFSLKCRLQFNLWHVPLNLLPSHINSFFIYSIYIYTGVLCSCTKSWWS